MQSPTQQRKHCKTKIILAIRFSKNNVALTKYPAEQIVMLLKTQLHSPTLTSDNSGSPVFACRGVNLHAVKEHPKLVVMRCLVFRGAAVSKRQSPVSVALSGGPCGPERIHIRPRYQTNYNLLKENKK